MSAKPHLKPHRSAKTSVRNKSNHLKLVVGSSPSKNRGPMAWSMLLIAAGVMGYAWMVGQTYFSTPVNWSASNAVSSLLPAFQKDGIEGYLVAKARLREQVRAGLQTSETSPQREEAEKIAVYLFPELLPEADFEKVEAIEAFNPEIETIETRPRTEHAEEAYARLRAEIWNFENASREEPELSEVGTQVLQLFAALAAL